MAKGGKRVRKQKFRLKGTMVLLYRIVLHRRAEPGRKISSQWGNAMSPAVSFRGVAVGLEERGVGCYEKLWSSGKKVAAHKEKLKREAFLKML